MEDHVETKMKVDNKSREYNTAMEWGGKQMKLPHRYRVVIKDCIKI